MTKIVSLFLVARPSFFEGLARVLDLGGTLNEYNTSINAEQADELALAVDIEALRQDVASVRQELRDKGHVQVQA